MAQVLGQPATEIVTEVKKLKRELTILPLFGLIYFTVCGGSFGIEPLVGWSGPGLAILLVFLTPLVFSIPNMLMVRELNSMMPVEGGYYHWVKQAFGPFFGFMAGWNNWMVSWLDVTIYPVLAVLYLSYFFPALEQGTVINGVEIPASLLSWLLAVVIIWAISYLQIRGSKLSGMTTIWFGVIMIIPLILMSLVGIYNIFTRGETASLPFLPQGENLLGAFSVGLFVVMWNYMGWELPTVAGDEIVNPKKTYPRAMTLVLIAAILTYTIPLLAGLYGGAGDDGLYQIWGIEEYADGEGIGVVLDEYGVPAEQLAPYGVDPGEAYGWEFPQIAHRLGEVAGSNSLAVFLGSTVTIAAVLSMLGLFIGNSLGGSRVPFALAEDGMMPRWLVHVHGKYGTPWVAIIFVGIIYSIFSLNAFAFLVVADVFLQTIVILAEFAALWVLRFKLPDMPRQKVPGGYFGLVLVTLGPVAIILLAIYSQYAEAGFTSIGYALVGMAIGAVLYFPLRRLLKPGVPDVDPFKAHEEELF
jgi:amino acid transporter